jgi:hypothetical protein
MDLRTLGLIFLGLWAAHKVGVGRGRSLESAAERLWAMLLQEKDPEKKKTPALMWNGATGAPPDRRGSLNPHRTGGSPDLKPWVHRSI